MKLSEDEAKRFLERLCPLQETEQQLLCPRCGRNELYSGLYFFLNSLSRYAHVYICEKCWMDEALREIDGNPDQLERSSSFCFERRDSSIGQLLPRHQCVCWPRANRRDSQ